MAVTGTGALQELIQALMGAEMGASVATELRQRLERDESKALCTMMGTTGRLLVRSQKEHWLGDTR